jgi:isopentenyl diphosphate isomerase/L-lactate dehydrogenase-like FMN-dependent dehydrogenase
MNGRPFLRALALGAHERVPVVLRSPLPDLDLTMALSGLTTSEQVDSAPLTLRREGV